MEFLRIDASRWCDGLSLATGLMVMMIGVPAWAQQSPTPDNASVEVLLAHTMAPSGGEPRYPRHIVVDVKLHALVDELLRRSPAFRRQWQRLASCPALSLRIDLVARSPVADSHAATTVSARPDGALMAVVSIPGGSRVPELIGHEVEHIMEWLDGARLAARHVLGDASVRRTSGTFESRRAVLVGRLVSAEFAKR